MAGQNVAGLTESVQQSRGKRPEQHEARHARRLQRCTGAANCAAHGGRPQAELARFYSQSSVFCLASIEDGFGMVILQAMACGLPVLASDHTGAADVVRDGVDGYIVGARDVSALKEKILEMYENPERREAMGESARKRVSSGFTWDAYGDRVAAAYSQAISERTA